MTAGAVAPAPSTSLRATLTPLSSPSRMSTSATPGASVLAIRTASSPDAAIPTTAIPSPSTTCAPPRRSLDCRPRSGSEGTSAKHRSPPGRLTLGLPPKMPPHRRASAFDGLGHSPLHVSRRALALRHGGGRVTACRVHAGWVSGRPRPPPISRSSPTSRRARRRVAVSPAEPLRGRLGESVSRSATASVPSRLPSAVSSPMDPRSPSSASAGHPRRFERIHAGRWRTPWPRQVLSTPTCRSYHRCRSVGGPAGLRLAGRRNWGSPQ